MNRYLRVYLGEAEIWGEVCRVYKSPKKRRREMLKMLRDFDELALLNSPDWCPELRGVG